MSRGAHLALGIVLLWMCCVCYYVAFTMGHSASSPGYFAKTERQLASLLQGQGGTGTAFQTVSLTDAGSAQALGMTEGGGV
jgi:hypothetical protein